MVQTLPVYTSTKEDCRLCNDMEIGTGLTYKPKLGYLYKKNHQPYQVSTKMNRMLSICVQYIKQKKFRFISKRSKIIADLIVSNFELVWVAFVV